MAGKPRRRLEYAGWNTDIFDNDTKIDKLLDAQGWIGFCIYFFLCQKAFSSDGYFYRWCFDDSATTARKMGCGIGAGAVEETVNYCLRIGLFDKRLFDRWNVITSKGIQRSYWAVAKNRRDKTVYQELWLLEKSESDGVVFVRLKTEMSGANDHLSAANSHLSATNEIVVKESKVKGNNNIMSDSDEPEQPAPKPSKPMKHKYGEYNNVLLTDEELKKLKAEYPDLDDRIERLSSYMASTGKSYKSHYATIRNWARKDAEQQKPVRQEVVPSWLKKHTKPGFNDFQQNEYDFDQLESELISN